MKWTKEKAWNWYNNQAWLCGFNYLPQTAVNWTELWQQETFDIGTISKELQWAQKIGFNTLRINIQFLVWKHDRTGLIKRIDKFLSIAKERNIKVMLTLLDDCGFSGEHPYLGPQKEPVPGIHNSQAAASPGRNVVIDKTQWKEVEAYVKNIITTFKNDERILIWDLYNEPGNTSIFCTKNMKHANFDKRLIDYSYELMQLMFVWAREIQPQQPLTVGAWSLFVDNVEIDELNKRKLIDKKALELSDVISFHLYQSCEDLVQVITTLKQHERPMLCTEWMARHLNSTILDILPVFQKEKIACYQWGLVKGRTQTHIPWPQIIETISNYTEEHSQWFHDLLYPDGTPYSNEEVQKIKEMVSKKQ